MVSFSVITASYNNESSIQHTLDSLGQQIGAKYEHILIDGGSSDNTCRIIKKSEVKTLVISEEDKGLYDALNKGLSIATNDIIVFLHADDVLAAHDVFLKISKYFEDPKVDAVYGNLQYLSNDFDSVVRYWRSGEPKGFNTGWMPPHPALFVRKTIFDKVGVFRLDMGSAADYEWMLRAIEVHKIKLIYCPINAVNMRLGGMSNNGVSSRIEGLKYDLRAWEINGLGKNYLAVILKKIRKIPQYFR